MKFGICYDLKKTDAIAALGFDYIEGHVTGVAALSDGEFADLQAFLAKQPIQAEAFCVLFPGGLKLVGPEADMAAVETYLDKALPRVAALGASSVVFGSGRARTVPEGFDRAQAWHQLVTLGRMLGEKAAKHGLVVVLEPLNTGECNIINTQLEGLALVADVNHENFQILTDLYHLHLGGEGEEEVAACGGRLRHAHISDPVGRTLPAEGDGIDYVAFFRGMAKAGYDARVSYEGAIPDDAMLPAMLAYLKTQYAQAKIQ